MPAMATFDDSAGYADPLPVAHRHPGARVARRADKRPAAAFLPESRKKCGHCQDMKPCVEFSADVSRGDGLRGWCKMCEADARSNRYKKRKAAAIEHSVSRRRLEQPLGGLPAYHQPQQPQQQAQAQASLSGFQQQALQHALELYHQQNPGLALPPQLQQLLQQAQLQQHTASQEQQQQQQPPPLALLQQQMATWQAQKAASAAAVAAGEQRVAMEQAPQQHRSAFHPVSPAPHGGHQQPASTAAVSGAFSVLAGAGVPTKQQGRPQHRQQQPVALPSGEALAAYLASEAAAGGFGGHTAQTLASIVPRLMPGSNAAIIHDQATAAKAAAAAAVGAAPRPPSPATSDSELSAGEILTGMKHDGGSGGTGFSSWNGSPAKRDSQAREPALWRGSAGSEDSGCVSMPMAAHAKPPSELQVPRRSRTRPQAAAVFKLDPPAAAAPAAAPVATPPATPPASPPHQAERRAAEPPHSGVSHFSSQFLALLLTMRAVAFNSSSGRRGA